MVTQNLNRGDAETGRRGEEETGRHGDAGTRGKRTCVEHCVKRFRGLVFLSLYLGVSALIITSCGSKPVNLQSMAPADALVYLETNDLGKTVQALTENKQFQQLAAKTPDLSALKGIQLAVAVTGFEVSEQKLEGDDRGLNFKPRFVAIAETHAWDYQALAFAENKLGEFVTDFYGGEVDEEKQDKNGGKYFTWTSQDGRKSFALVLGSQILFGNDESAIEKCLAVKRGDADSFAKTSRLQPTENSLAAGYISTDGVAQIATLAGTVLGKRSGENEDVQKFISGLLPPLLQNTVKDVTWTASKTGDGIEDRLTFASDKEVTSVWKETLVRSGTSDENLATLLPPVPFGVTRYDLRDPQVAWRSILLLAAKQTGNTYGPILLAYSGSLFDPYGITDSEMFLSAVGPRIITARFDQEGEKMVVVATVKDVEKVKKAIGGEINFGKPAEKQGSADVWKSEDGDLAAAFVEDKLVLGDAESVRQCLARGNASNFTVNEVYGRFSASDAVAVTFGRDAESAGRIVDVLSDRKPATENAETMWITETRYNEKGIERRTISDFGLIGEIVAHLEQ